MKIPYSVLYKILNPIKNHLYYINKLWLVLNLQLSNPSRNSWARATWLTSHLENQHNQGDERQAGWCHIQCLNAAVYTDWLNKSVYICGRRVNFIPHKGSIDGSAPNSTVIHLAHAPVREVIAQNAQAMSNYAAATPSFRRNISTKPWRI